MNLEKIIDNISERQAHNNRKYYNGEHWSYDGVITTLGHEIKDIIKSGEKHKGHVSNYIKIIMDDYIQLLSGTGTENFEGITEKDKKLLKYIDFSNFSKFWLDLGLTGYAYIKPVKGQYGKIVIDSYGTDEATELDGKTYLIKKTNSNFSYDYDIKEYDGYTVKTYKNSNLISEDEIGYNPIVRIGNGKPFITKDFLMLQDNINISFTRINKTEKMVADPFISIIGVAMENSNEYQMLSGQVKAFKNPNVKVTKLSNDSVDTSFYTTIEKNLNTLFQMAKLNGYQNLKQSSYTSIVEVISSMTQTVTLINSIKTNIKEQLKYFFNKVFTLHTGFTVKDFDFIFQPTEVDLLKQSTKETNEIDLNIKKSEQNFKNAMAIKGLVEAGFTKEEAILYLNK